ncbi:MAG: Mrp/NBP35 family ATP-binding protein [Bacillota bacterium]
MSPSREHPDIPTPVVNVPGGGGGAEAHQGFGVPAPSYNQIKRVVAVMSGKGGVGKSSVAGLLAVDLTRKGFKVGILDADITGPSIPKEFGIRGPVNPAEEGIDPPRSTLGIKVMSLNLFLEREEDPVIWRGPLITSAIKQFWTDVVWGELDYLIVDLPPGTGDATLTVLQSLPLDGIVVVTSPQEVVTMVVRKAIKMAEMLGVKMLGVVENYAYVTCPDTGKKLEIFGPSHVEEITSTTGLPVLASLPIDPELAKLADQGRIEEYRPELGFDLSEQLPVDGN